MEIFKTILAKGFDIFLGIMGFGLMIAIGIVVISLILYPFIKTFSIIKGICKFIKSIVTGIFKIIKAILGFFVNIYYKIFYRIRGLFYKNDINFYEIACNEAHDDPNVEAHFDICKSFNKIIDYKKAILKPLVGLETSSRCDLLLFHKSGVYIVYHFDAKNYTEKRKKILLVGRKHMSDWRVSIDKKNAMMEFSIENLAYNFPNIANMLNKKYGDTLGKEIPCHFVVTHNKMLFDIDTLDGKVHICKPHQIHKYIKEISKNTSPENLLTNEDIAELEDSLIYSSYRRTSLESQIETAKQEALEKYFRTGTLSISSYNDFV